MLYLRFGGNHDPCPPRCNIVNLFFLVQRKHIWTNVRLVLVPLFLCLLLLSIQLLLEAVMSKVSDMAKCGSKDAPNGDYCPIPNPPLLPPMLHIPEPESRAVKAGFFPYSDLPDLSCRKTKTCPFTMLLTGKNQSLGKGMYICLL